jgi:hypothetical protein
MNSDPVLGLDQYTLPGIQYYQMIKIKQYGWLIYSHGLLMSLREKNHRTCLTQQLVIIL